MCELETTKRGYRESNDHLIHEKRSLTFEKEHRKPRCADEKNRYPTDLTTHGLSPIGTIALKREIRVPTRKKLLISSES